MKVTVGIIALNEQDNISALFDNLLSQTYPKQDTQIILVDSGSTDDTKGMMQRFAQEHGEYWSIKVLDNVGRVQPSGWNVVVDNADGEIIIRVDAHALIPDDFVAKNVECIESGEDVCGGRRINIINSSKASKQVLLMAENSMFGAGIAGYRRETTKEYVKTVAHACYKKQVFDKVGKFDERLLRAEDNDMHYRIRQAGYKICKSGEILSQYQTRPTFKGMVKQKFGNGKWIGVASAIKTPKMFSLYHFVPMLFVLGLFVATALLIPAIVDFARLWWLGLPFACGVGAYILCDLLLTLKSVIDYKTPLGLITLPFLFPILHISYGLGTWVGLATAGKYKEKK